LRAGGGKEVENGPNVAWWQQTVLAPSDGTQEGLGDCGRHWNGLTTRNDYSHHQNGLVFHSFPRMK